MNESKIKILQLEDKAYPEVLKNIYSPPSKLFYKGEILAEDCNAVAIVGSRRCTAYGMQMSEKIAFDLALRGITVVSGMAKGIDQAAHRGAIKAGGRTIAVMGSGFNHIYPPGSERLVREIIEQGAVITEYTNDIRPFRMNFPKRNRIISGLSKGVIVVEAAEKSGALITVDFALDQGKDIFAVPGRMDSAASRGTNLLIQNGAKIVTGIDDILSELDLCTFEDALDSGKVTCKEREFNVTDMQKNILQTIKKIGHAHIDKLKEETGMEPGKLAEELLRLQIRGRVRALAGSSYSLDK